MKAKERDIKAAYKQYAARVRSEIATDCDRAKDFTPKAKVVGLSLFRIYNYDFFRDGYLEGFKAGRV